MTQGYDLSDIIALEDFSIETMKDVENFLNMLGPDIIANLAAHKSESEVSDTIESRESGSVLIRSDPLEVYLTQKTARSYRIKETFGPMTEEKRTKIKPRGGEKLGNWLKKMDHIKPKYSLTHEEISSGVDKDIARLTKENYWGTNQILENILRLSENSKRTDFLRKFNGNCLCGADIVRAAFQVADFYGLTVNYSETPQGKEILKAVIDSIYRGCNQLTDLNRSIQLTDLLIEGFGLERMPELMRKYQPFRKMNSLVPKGDVYTIATAMQLPEFRRLKGPALMHELDYQFVEVNRIPVLYYRPPMKPI